LTVPLVVALVPATVTVPVLTVGGGVAVVVTMGAACEGPETDTCLVTVLVNPRLSVTVSET
jgi:hypothetical protein